MIGFVKLWLANKAYGYLRPSDGTKDVFFHGSTVQGAVAEGDAVEYDLASGTKVPQARRVALLPGPVIYNLFPKLAGAMQGWNEHLKRARDMGFDTVYVNPFHYPGFSGSIYAPKDYFGYDPLIQGSHEKLRACIAEARALGLRFMMDLVINHTSIDCPLVNEHPTWYKRDKDGKVENPTAIDPADARKVTVWGDLAEIDNAGSPDRKALWDYWIRLVEFYQDLGVQDFRGDAAYKVPAELWTRIIRAARKKDPHARFFAETLGCKMEEIAPLARAGFDYIFNSLKWWDLGQPWLLEQYNAFRLVAPSIAFPESHDTPRLAEELSGNLQALKSRYALSALFSTGVMTVFGYEFAYRKALDVVKTNPFDAEPRTHDIGLFIGKTNHLKATYPVFHTDCAIKQVSKPEDRVLVLKKSHGPERALILVNRSHDKPETIELGDLAPLLDGASNIRDVSPEDALEALPAPFKLELPAAAIKVLYTKL